MSGSQVGTALAGTLDSASIARLVQQLMSTQNLGETTGATQSGASTGASAGSTNLGSTNQQSGTSGAAGDQTAGLQSNDYATMLQQLLALLYGRGGTSGASGGGNGSSGGSEGGGVGGGSGGVG